MGKAEADLITYPVSLLLRKILNKKNRSTFHHQLLEAETMGKAEANLITYQSL